MPIATPEIYAAMLDRAKAGAFAYPAINVSSSQTLNAALRGFAQAKSDGIVQVSTGGASYLSGVDDMALGARALAEYAHVVAAKYPVQIALHTDHCPKDRLDRYVRPLIKLSQERVRGDRARSFSPTCGTARRCRYARTSRSRASCWPPAPRPRSCWSWRSAW
jgi:fructose-bisphosphate aldolase class II